MDIKNNNYIPATFILLSLSLYALTPKVGLSGVYFYVSDIILFGLLLFTLRRNMTINVNYFPLLFVLSLFIIYCMISLSVNTTNETKYIFSYIKQVLIFFYLYVFLKYDYDPNFILKVVISSWLLIIVMNLLLILYDSLIHKHALMTYLYNYSPFTRVMGFTGTGISFTEGLRSSIYGNELGTTSISFSILSAYLFILVSLSKLKYKGAYGLVFLIATLLTMSRGGIIILLSAYIVSYFIKQGREYRHRLILVFIPLLLISVIFIPQVLSVFSKFNVFEWSLSSTGQSGLSTAQSRIYIWTDIIQYYMNQPLHFITGTVLLNIPLADVFTSEQAKGVIAPGQIFYAESLFFDLIARFGMLGLLLFIFIFLVFYIIVLSSKAKADNDYFNVRSSLLLFFPGLITMNILSGASLLTDFFLPLLLFLIVYCKRVDKHHV